MSAATVTRRLLRSPLVDVLVGPHGIDRYLELIRPGPTVRDARAATDAPAGAEAHLAGDRR